MTDFQKVKHYYSHFDEKNRLRNDNSGKLEYLMTMQILEKYLPHVEADSDAEVEVSVNKQISILDLGGGTGVYSFPLAKFGYQVTLADLSEDLLAQAKKQKEEDMIYKLKNKAAFKDILNLINQTATDKSIIETCGHAMYVGVKK